jgi:sugar transferase (PEP-CTERM/EpsH1 system associated)
MGDILFLAHRVPYPPDRGDKIRAFHILRHIARHKRVHLAAFADAAEAEIGREGLAPLTASRTIVRRTKPTPLAAVESLIRREPASISAFRHRGMAAGVARILKRCEIESIYVFSSQMAQFAPARLSQRTVMDFVDVDSAKFAAYADRARWPMDTLYAREARLLLAHDQAVAERVRASLFVSSAEAALFRDRTHAERVTVVENGIDTTVFDPTADFARRESSAPLIVFTGQMDYPPNIEAAQRLVTDILPHVRLAVPDARVAIVGRAPTSAVRALAGQGVTVTGEVPDVRPWLASASVIAAPLKIARGVQNKVLEAMAMARPVVASAEAAEGIDHAGTIRVGHDVGGIADAIVALLRRPQDAATLGSFARAQVIARYGWEARLAPLDDLLGLPSTPRATS